MRAVVLDVETTLSSLLAERARLGLDDRDEMWEGELHMVPPPSQGHQFIGSQLLRVLGPLTDELGLTITYETGFFRAADDYRQPDLAVYRSADVRHHGIEGAELVVEIRSPGDESTVKIPWYLARGCREVLIVDRDTLDVQMHTTEGLRDVATSDVLGCTFETIEGPAVRITWEGGEAVVDGAVK